MRNRMTKTPTPMLGYYPMFDPTPHVKPPPPRAAPSRPEPPRAAPSHAQEFCWIRLTEAPPPPPEPPVPSSVRIGGGGGGHGVGLGGLDRRLRSLLSSRFPKSQQQWLKKKQQLGYPGGLSWVRLGGVGLGWVEGYSKAYINQFKTM